MKNKTLYTLFAILFLASFVSADYLVVSPDFVTSSIVGEIDPYVFSGSPSGVWVNVSNIYDGDFDTFGYLLPNQTKVDDDSYDFSWIEFKYYLPLNVNLSESFIISKQEGVDDGSTFVGQLNNWNLSTVNCEVLNDDGGDYIIVRDYSEIFVGYAGMTDMFCFNSGSGYSFNFFSDTLDGEYITSSIGNWTNGLITDVKAQSIYENAVNWSCSGVCSFPLPQQNIQSSNFEILGSTGLGLSRFFGSLTSSLSGLLLIFAIVGAIVLVLGGVVFLVMYAINYAKTR
jgi:hypothetical protein